MPLIRLKSHLAVLAVLSAGACFRHPTVDGDELACVGDDNCLAGYVCTKSLGDSAESLGRCVRLGIWGAEPSDASGQTPIDVTASDDISAFDGGQDTAMSLVDANNGQELGVSSDVRSEQAPSVVDQSSDQTAGSDAGQSQHDNAPDDRREEDVHGESFVDLSPRTPVDVQAHDPDLGDTDDAWVGPADADAESPIDCGPLGAPANGFVEATGSTLNTTAVYSCRAGFTMIGFASRTCLADGSWSGQAPKCQCTSGTTNCNGVCIDTRTDNRNCGFCGNACVAAPPSSAADCNAGRCLVTLASGQGTPLGLAVDASHVYWTVVESNTTVKKIPLGGGTPVSLGPAQSSEPFGLAIDAQSAYWTDYLDGTVRKIPLMGGSATTVATGQGLADFVVVRDSTLYWTNALTPSGTVMKLGPSDSAPLPIATNQHSPQGIALDGRYVYWANHGAGDGDGEIRRALKTTGVSSLLVSAQRRPYDLAVDSTNIYWSNLGDISVNYVNGSIMKATLSGTSVTALVADVRYPECLVVDASSVYWIQANAANDCSIMKVSREGGPPTSIALRQKNPTRIAVDSTSVYWVDNQAGTIMKATPK